MAFAYFLMVRYQNYTGKAIFILLSIGVGIDIRAIKLPMPENDQWMTNIRTIMSKNPLNNTNLTLAARTEECVYH